MYEYQGFHSGEKLKATQLVAMEDGIINAEKLAMEAVAGAANMEKGTGDIATQQVPRADKVTQAEGETCPHFNFAGHTDAGMAGRIQYGAVGNYSASMNGRSAALNKHAFAINNSTIAKGEESFAQGYETIAEGNSSFAGGSGTYAKGEASVALGISTKASGDYSFATGVHSSATNEASFAEGHRTESLGIASHAEGSETEAKGTCSHAQNYITKAIGDYSTATGVETVAEGIASFTAGRGTKATIDSQMVIGRYNNNMGALFEVGNGTSDEDRKTAFAVLEDGTVWASKAPTKSNHVVRLGDLSGAINTGISNMGLKPTGGGSVSQKQANAFADSSAAFNQGKATNVLTFAAGTNTEASGYGATAFGVNTVSKNAYGFTTGEGTQTGLYCQTVVGKYNLGTQGLFEVGCGSGEANRQNGFAVTADGYIIIKRPGTNEYYYLSKLFDSLNAWVDTAKI